MLLASYKKRILLNHIVVFRYYYLCFDVENVPDSGTEKPPQQFLLSAELSFKSVCHFVSFWDITFIFKPDVMSLHAHSSFPSCFQTEESYFSTVKLIYTIGYSISLVVLAFAVFILLFFRYDQASRAGVRFYFWSITLDFSQGFRYAFSPTQFQFMVYWGHTTLMVQGTFKTKQKKQRNISLKHCSLN